MAGTAVGREITSALTFFSTSSFLMSSSGLMSPLALEPDVLLLPCPTSCPSLTNRLFLYPSCVRHWMLPLPQNNELKWRGSGSCSRALYYLMFRAPLKAGYEAVVNCICLRLRPRGISEPYHYAYYTTLGDTSCCFFLASAASLALICE